MAKIPTFISEEEEARYWDKESVADHLDELEPVTLEVKTPLIHTLSVRLSKEDMKRLRLLGRERGLGTTTMARYLLREALREPRSPSTARAVSPPEPPGEADEHARYYFTGDDLKKVAAAVAERAEEAVQSLAQRRAVEGAPDARAYRPATKGRRTKAS